jgi:hypothetical protein
MATFNKFDSFVEALTEEVHNFAADQLKVALTDAAHPPVAANTVLANLTEVSYTNCSTRNVTTSTHAQTSGTYKLVCADLVLTASGAVGPFQYVVLYNDGATNKELIGWYNYGSEITLASGETLTIDFDQSGGVLTIV